MGAGEKARSWDAASHSSHGLPQPCWLCELTNSLLGVYLSCAARRVLTNGRVKKGREEFMGGEISAIRVIKNPQEAGIQNKSSQEYISQQALKIIAQTFLSS